MPTRSCPPPLGAGPFTGWDVAGTVGTWGIRSPSREPATSGVRPSAEAVARMGTIRTRHHARLIDEPTPEFPARPVLPMGIAAATPLTIPNVPVAPGRFTLTSSSDGESRLAAAIAGAVFRRALPPATGIRGTPTVPFIGGRGRSVAGTFGPFGQVSGGDRLAAKERMPSQRAGQGRSPAVAGTAPPLRSVLRHQLRRARAPMPRFVRVGRASPGAVKYSPWQARCSCRPHRNTC
jgi:hypothetical protein